MFYCQLHEGADAAVMECADGVDISEAELVEFAGVGVAA
ncbi:MAG: hypothetical protein RI897_2965 [Verrucomicrobiota bacterium]